MSETRKFNAVVINHKDETLWLDIDLGFRVWKTWGFKWNRQLRLNPGTRVKAEILMERVRDTVPSEHRYELGSLEILKLT